MKAALGMALLATVLFAACSGKSDGPDPTPKPTPTPPTPEKLQIKISPSVKDTRSTGSDSWAAVKDTRSTGSDSWAAVKDTRSMGGDTRATDTAFEAGDEVGLFVVNYSGSTPGTLAPNGNHVTNMRFRYNGEWTSATQLYWADEETHADFYLYYPFTSVVESVDAYAFATKADQSAESAYKASDLMIGKTTNVTPTSSAVGIPVSHVMSRIVITLAAGEGFTQEAIAASDVSVKINGVKCNSTVDLASGEITAIGEPSTVTPLLSAGSYKALIVPQTVEEGDLITVNVDGRDFTLKKGFTFESKKSHNFTVTLSKTSGGVKVTINPWEDDGTDNGGVAE